MADIRSTLLLFISTSILGGINCQNAENLDGCMPQLADRCFDKLIDLIPCNLKNLTGECFDQSVEFDAFCNGINDALSCSSDIIDSDCSIAEGRQVFDNWLKGLDAVGEFFCSKGYQSMTVLAQNAHCWHIMTYLDCLRKKTRLDHVVKLLHSMLDANECIYLVGAASECNILAITKDAPSFCSSGHSLEFIAEAIHTFFSTAKCQCVSQQLITSSANKVQLETFGVNIILMILAALLSYK